MIFYFTGTGNSLYAAECLEENPVSIPQMIEKDPTTFAADKIGIVCPVYGHEAPRMVKEFLKKNEFQTDYFYMILTYGNRHGGAAELAAELCEKCGVWPSYINILLMADNWLPSFDMEEQAKLDKKVEEQLSAIKADIDGRIRGIAKVTDEDRAAHRQFLENTAKMPEEAWQHLIRIGESCIGCGVCSKVCPSASIHIEDDRAAYTAGKCETCLACVHACPMKAIGLNMPEKNPNARYRNEHISLEALMEANCRVKEQSR